jgi:Flp pilus assembly protein TadG
MNLKRICHDEHGATLVEATITMPLFLSLTFGVLQAGLLLWTQAGLQHGVDMAARCATVNDAAITAGASTSLCFRETAPGSVTKATIQNYAATNSWGINPAASIFVVKTYKDDAWQCSGVNGNQVSVSYTFNLINYMISLNLSAQSCYPTF